MNLMQSLSQFGIDTRRRDGAHRLKVKHLRSLFKGNPQAEEMVLTNVTATVATQCCWRSRITETCHCVAVIAHQSASVRAYPYKAVGVLKYVIGEIVWHTRCHIQIAYVILAEHLILCKTVTPYYKCK